MEVANGSPESNRVYCSKEGDWKEFGSLPKERVAGGEMEVGRWDLPRCAAKEGRFDDIYMRDMSACHKLASMHQAKPESLGVLANIWLWGPTWSGKTSRAFQMNPNAYIKGLNKWWDGYDGQEDVIIDDMNPYHKSMSQDFKQWGHHYPFHAETKGGSLCIRPS